MSPNVCFISFSHTQEDIEKTLQIYEKICKKVISGLDEKKYQSMIQGKMHTTVWTMKIEPTKKRT